MLKIEDHTADVKLILKGDICEIIRDLVGYITKTKECSNSGEFFYIDLEEQIPEMFFVNLINTLIAELEIREVKPVCYKIEYCEEFKAKIMIFYVKDRWYNRIKAATFHNLRYSNNTLEIVLDI